MLLFPERSRLNRYFRGFVISGDSGTRKPDPAIYRCLLDKAGFRAADTVFVDDRLRNIEAAHALGITGILFKPSPQDSQGHAYTVVRAFPELINVLYRQ